jgi:hypothetical protein
MYKSSMVRSNKFGTHLHLKVWAITAGVTLSKFVLPFKLVAKAIQPTALT